MEKHQLKRRDEKMIMTENHADLFADKVEARNLQLAIQHSSDIITRVTNEGIALYVSPSCLPMLGYTQQEFYKSSLYTYCHPNDRDLLREAFAELDLLPLKRVTFRFRHHEGHYLWLEANFSVINEDKEMMGIIRDMTQRIIMEEEILETQEKYRFLVEYSKDTIGMVTQKGIWTYINNEGKKLFGFTSSKEIIGTSLHDYAPSSEHSTLDDFLQTKQSVNFELNLIRTDNQTRKAEVQLIPTTFKNRKVYQIIIKDVTGQKKTEEKLQNAEKLSVVGQLAAGIAHEIRNPLTAIKGFTQLLNEERQGDFADVILTELERIEDIVNDLLVLAKPQITEMEETNLITVVKSVITLLNSQAVMGNIMIELTQAQCSFNVKCERDKIKQVLINIIKNSIEAMPMGGKINVDIRQDNNFVIISVEDEGIGIPEERLAKLGEPFYSTKEKGTGLGIMICKKIIKNHGGNLYIHSKENEGTTVRITLPLV
jgi:two-component system sporulation sensor kinase A